MLDLPLTLSESELYFSLKMLLDLMALCHDFDTFCVFHLEVHNSMISIQFPTRSVSIMYMSLESKTLRQNCLKNTYRIKLLGCTVKFFEWERDSFHCSVFADVVKMLIL